VPDPIRILFVTDHTYPPQRVGGAESSTHDLTLTLKEKGVEVAVLATIDIAGYVGFRNRILRRVLKRGHFPADHLMGYPVFRGHDPTKAAPEMLERFQPSAVVVTSGKSSPFSHAFLRVGVPTIVYLRDVEVPLIGGPLPRDPSVAYISNSRFNAARMKAVVGVDPVVIPPLVRPERFRTETTRSRVLFVNPVPEKGVDLAFRLAESRPDIPFDFVEAWPLTKRTRAPLLARARAISNLAWHPAVNDPSRLYRDARILLVPSMWEESWGRVVTEAHCNGIPALASNRGGLPESVGPGGILVEHDAPLGRWREALSCMWDDQATYRVLRTAAQHYSTRPEIQPALLADKFLRLVTQHVARCSSLAAG
jgi:glycosyltransferase involved in cell wall biosynthesis